MNNIATAALMLNLTVAGIYAQPGPANITISGSAAASTISLQPDSPTSEYQLAGVNGRLGAFTFRVVSTSIPSAQPSSTCAGPNKLDLSAVAGAGVIRSQNGGLLKVNLTGGSDCIDFSVGAALCTRIFQITGGTDRFKDASGTVTLTMTVVPVMADSSNNPVFFAVTGTVSGIPIDQGPQDAQP
jgi:hypothetical protein